MSEDFDSTTVHLGTVARLDARGCVVHLDTPLADLEPDPRELWCSVRGRIHLRDRTHQKSPLAVGDRVEVTRTALDRGAVEAAQPRRSMLSRPDIRRQRREHVMAANVDQVVVVSAADDPPFTPGLVDRMLAVIEYSDLEAIIVINKMDLVDAPPEEAAAYEAMDYPVLQVSATTGHGIEAVRERLTGRVSVVAGHSGVGKSSLLNAVQPELGLVVGAVNVVTGRGTHTTTAAAWIPLEGGGAVIDTAGIREFGLYGIPERDLGWLFRDIARIAPGCRFPDCRHTQEPGCAVQVAADDGRLAEFRYMSYLRMLEAQSETPGY